MKEHYFKARFKFCFGKRRCGLDSSIVERYVKKEYFETPKLTKFYCSLDSALGLELTFLRNSKKKETCVLWAIHWKLRIARTDYLPEAKQV